ncbi:hypothetical protein LTS17_012435 [Exophiala oligosperma]
MPRPALRRRHLNRNAPTPRYGGKIPNSSPAKVELEKKLAHKPVGQRPTDSDDSDRLVVKGSGRRTRQRQEIFASGAVGSGDTPGAYPSRAQRRKNMIQDTRDILANAQQTSSEHVADAPSEQSRQDGNAPLTNGKVRKASSIKQGISAPTPAVVSSAVKAPATLLGSAQPTPSRETSILGNLKPRRRQPSILQDLGNDSSTFDLADEEQFLPDDESTPYNLSKSHNAPITPATNSPQLSTSSKKRKFGSSDPVQSHMDNGRTSSPLATMDATTASPQPALPPMPASALRQSGRKCRERAEEEDDILAPPESSSSSSPSSPAKISPGQPAKKTTRAKPSEPSTTMTTEQLRALMMPTKRRKTTRGRTRLLGEFDVPMDSDANSDNVETFDDDEGDESSFLPTQRKGRKTRGKEQSSTKTGRRKTSKASSDSAEPPAVKQKKKKATATVTAATARTAAKSGSRSKSSTRKHFTTAAATTAPILTPSTSTTHSSPNSRRNRETKSPSQFPSTRTVELSKSIPQVDLDLENRHRKLHGGSHLGRGGRRRQPENYIVDKENLTPDDDEEEEEEEEGEEFSSNEFRSGEGESDGSRVVTTNVGGKSVVVEKGRGKWADIDAWDMDFEDVEVMTGSGGSSPMRR